LLIGAVFLIAHTAIAQAHGYAFDLTFNGRNLDTAPRIETELHREVVEGIPVPGVTVGELLPLILEVHSITIETADGERTNTSGHPADFLFKWVLFQSGSAEDGSRSDGAASNRSAWNLYTQHMVYEAVRSIEIDGIELPLGELSVWLSWERVDVLEKEIDRFADLFGVHVEVNTIPDTAAKLVATERARGHSADVVLIQSDYLPDLLEIGALQPVPDTGGTGRGSDAFRKDDRMWAIPLYFDAQLVFYNPELLKGRPQPAWALDDMEDLATTAAERAEAPMAWNAYSAYWLTPFMLGFGKDQIIAEDGQVHVNDEPTHRAVRYLLDLRELGLLRPMERGAMTAYFTSGRAGMILDGSYSIPNLESLGVPFDVAPFPRVESDGTPVRPFLDFKGLAI